MGPATQCEAMPDRGLTEALAETLTCFDGSGTPLTTTEVTDELGVGRRSAYDRLDRLVDQDYLETKKVGANARVWWQPQPHGGGSSADAVTTHADLGDEHDTVDRYESVFETVGDAIYVLDEDLRLVMVNESVVELTGIPRSELVGKPIAAVVGEDTVDRALQQEAELLEGDREVAEVEFTLSTEEGTVPVEARFTRRTRSDGTIERVGVARDITSRRERKRALDRYETIFETIDDGVYTVDPDGQFTMVNDAYAEMTGYPPDALIGEDVSKVVAEDTVETASTYEEELVAGDRDTVRFEAELHTADGDRFPAEAAFTILPEADDYERVGVVRDVSDRVARERQLERQRERLVALNDLNTVFRDVTDAVIEQSTRAEIETTVCETLTDSDSYSLAWIGGVAVDRDQVTIRTEAGYDNDCTSFELATAVNRTPTIVDDAVTDQRVAVTTTLDQPDDKDPWLAAVESPPTQSGAAIPVTSTNSLYGILTVYTQRGDGFDEQEQRVLKQLGEVVGHAITAVDRKQALTSETVVELEFEVETIFEPVDPTPPPTATIKFDHPIQVEEGAFIEYCTATPTAMDAVEAMVESSTVPNWDSLTILDQADDGVRFEIYLENASIFETIAQNGGYLREGRIDGNDLYMRLQFTPNTDIRRVVDAIQEANESIELITQQYVSRAPESMALLGDTALGTLTDRQRNALEAAVQRGYFQWPREADGDTLADTLDIAPATFHQHLRRAQQQLFTDLFDTVAPDQ